WMPGGSPMAARGPRSRSRRATMRGWSATTPTWASTSPAPRPSPAPAEPPPPRPGDLRGRSLTLQHGDLGQAEAVAGRVAEPGVDPVGALLGFLGELHAAALELLVVSPHAGRGEE